MIIQINRDRDWWRVQNIRFRPSNLAGYTKGISANKPHYVAVGLSVRMETVLVLQFKNASAKIDIEDPGILDRILVRMDEAFGFEKLYPSAAAKAKDEKVAKKKASKKKVSKKR